MLAVEKQGKKKKKRREEEEKPWVRKDTLPKVCHRSPIHMDWCLALYRGKPLPATPPPQDMLPLLMQLMMRDENLARLIRLKFPKIFMKLKPSLKKMAMKPGGPRRAARETLRKKSIEARETLRKIRREIKKELAKEKEVAKDTLREKKASALAALSPDTKRYVSRTLRRVRAYVG